MNRQSRVIREMLNLAVRVSAVAMAAGVMASDSPVVTPRMIVDFEDARAIRLSPDQAQASLVPAKEGQALQITTEAQANWPGVLIAPRQGVWDLAGYDAVEMDVRNPEDVPIRVLLSINNPGSDGEKFCNVASVTVSEQGKAVLVVPFGMWHGTAGHPMDLTKIVSMRVLLDRPGRAHRFEVDSIRAVTVERIDLAKIMADPFFRQLKPLPGRGVNLGNALEAPADGAWGVMLKESYFAQIKDAGFDTVRIPVRWSAFADATPPYRIDPKFFAKVDWAVHQALKQQLHTVLNMHHYDELLDQPEAHRARFLALWKQIAEHYKNEPPELLFELLNEPRGNLLADKWNRLLVETLAVVRPSNPTREIVIGPVGWNGISELKDLVLPEQDRHLIVTFHYYSPFAFTHQGASWVGPDAKQWLGTRWTGTTAEKQAIEHDFDVAIAWAVEHRRPLYLGEFGAFNKAPMESRERWTRFVAATAMKRKMGYTYWEFCSGFGVYDPAKDCWIQPLKGALLPRVLK
ncbi:MAG: cellulase family glycosylhydrolase [bacterium]